MKKWCGHVVDMNKFERRVACDHPGYDIVVSLLEQIGLSPDDSTAIIQALTSSSQEICKRLIMHTHTIFRLTGDF